MNGELKASGRVYSAEWRPLSRVDPPWIRREPLVSEQRLGLDGILKERGLRIRAVAQGLADHRAHALESLSGSVLGTRNSGLGATLGAGRHPAQARGPSRYGKTEDGT